MVGILRSARLQRIVLASAAVIVVITIVGVVWFYNITVWCYYEPDQALITLDQHRPCVLEEQERLQGRWRCHPHGIGSEIIFIDAGTWKRETDPFKGPEIGHFRLDPTTRPKRVDWIMGYGEVAKGIYELERDTFRLCFRTTRRPAAMPTVDPASDFVVAGDNFTLYVYTRVVEPRKEKGHP